MCANNLCNLLLLCLTFPGRSEYIKRFLENEDGRFRFIEIQLEWNSSAKFYKVSVYRNMKTNSIKNVFIILANGENNLNVISLPELNDSEVNSINVVYMLISLSAICLK